MKKKFVVSMVIVGLLVFMVLDFRINGVGVFEDYFRHMETESLRKLQQGDGSYRFHGGVSDDNKASRESTQTIAIKDISNLAINNPMGSVIVTGEDRKDLELEYKMTVYADSVERARELVKKVKILQEEKDEQLLVYLDRENLPGDVRAVKIDYKIKAPKEISLIIDNSYGQLRVEDMDGDVKLDNRYEEMWVRNLGGKADIDCRYGNLYLDGVAGETAVDTGYNKTGIKNVQSSLLLESGYAAVGLENITGPVEAQCKYGSLRIENLKDSLNLEAKYTGISGEGPAGKMKVDMKYGDLDLDNIGSELDVTSKYTDIKIYLQRELEDIELDLVSDYGGIHTNLPFEVKEDKSLKELKGIIGTGKVKIKLEADHGSITVRR